MKPELLKQKIESLLGQVENLELLDEVKNMLTEQVEKERREYRGTEVWKNSAVKKSKKKN